MAIELTSAKPWEPTDSERIAKFCKGELGKTSDIWLEKPDLAPCPRGDYREWHIEDGTCYQNQLYCGFWDMFINPSGFSCECCKNHIILNWQSSHLREAIPGLIAAQSKSDAGALIVKAVADGELTEKQAQELVDEFDLEGAD